MVKGSYANRRLGFCETHKIKKFNSIGYMNFKSNIFHFIFFLPLFIFYSCGGGNPGFNEFIIEDKLMTDKAFHHSIDTIFSSLQLMKIDIDDIKFEKFNISTNRGEIFTPLSDKKYICGEVMSNGKKRRKWFFGQTQWKKRDYYIIQYSTSLDSIKEMTLIQVTIEAPDEDYTTWRPTESVNDKRLLKLQEKIDNL